MPQSSIVEYFGKHEGYSCGYCKNSTSNYSHGMWGHYLTPEDYQDLIDRGWRRSGKFCYKPLMNQTCCPQYTIRCEAMRFKLSKSQKKVLKRMHKFLQMGRRDSETSSMAENEDHETHEQHMDLSEVPFVQPAIKKLSVIQPTATASANDISLTDSQSQEVVETSPSLNSKEETNSSISVRNGKGQGMDPNRSLCRKAKDIRRERKMQKLLKAGLSIEEASKSNNVQKCKEKSLEDFLSEPYTSQPAHTLQLRLVHCDPNDAGFSKTFQESHRIYRKYQHLIHNDPPEKCTESQFTRFLVTNPYQSSEEGGLSESRYGSYHHQYWLDSKLIAVGVLDILPHCVSSVYLYYDPDYSFLSLGTYASLRELALTRELNRKFPQLLHYYMGFYIHSCSKMRYKAGYSPSFLLCPETYSFQPVSQCIPKLNASKYSRLDEDNGKEDEDGLVNLKKVLILHQRQIKTYQMYRLSKKEATDERLVKEYAGLIGAKCYKKILLYRS